MKSRYPKCSLCKRKHDPKLTPGTRELLIQVEKHRRLVTQAAETRARKYRAAKAMADHPNTSAEERAAALAAMQRIRNSL